MYCAHKLGGSATSQHVDKAATKGQSVKDGTYESNSWSST
jgi:hypothetical protein